MICNLCPRECGAERTEQTAGGYCKNTLLPKVARAALHFGEEPCISGTGGSGTVFFSGCNLGCIYCQNEKISHGGFGKEISYERLAEIYKELENLGAENINLVTPTPQIYAILKSFSVYEPQVPVVFNCGGYEKTETLRLLSGKVDVYLTDIKYHSDSVAEKYSKAPRYFETVTAALDEMLSQVGEVILDERGMIRKGIIIRHLVLPGYTSETEKIIDWYAENMAGRGVYLSIMSQYTPNRRIAESPYTKMNRRITGREYGRVLDMLGDYGLENVYVQELSSASEEYIPDFDLTGI